MYDAYSRTVVPRPSWRVLNADEDPEIDEDLTEFVTRLSERYVDQFDRPRSDPFKILPQELHLLIAKFVAMHNHSPDDKISHHLFKSRLICSALARAAVDAFKQQSKVGGFERYTVLRLPPEKASLKSMLAALGHSRSNWGSTINSVIWELHFDDYENKPNAIYSFVTYDDLQHIRAEHARGAANIEISEHELAMRQRDSSQLLCSKSGLKVLGSVFRDIRDVKSLEVNVCRAPGWFDHAFTIKRDPHVANNSPLTRVFDCLETQSAFCVSSMTLRRMDATVFGQVSVSRMLRYNLNYALTDLTISFDFRQKYEDFNKGSMEWNLFLSGCENLASLTLFFDQDHRPFVNAERINIDWLTVVLQDQSWPHLRYFYLHHLAIKQSVLKNFLDRHHPSLQDVELYNIRIQPQRWVSFLNDLRDMRLEKVKVHQRLLNYVWDTVDPNMLEVTRQLMLLPGWDDDPDEEYSYWDMSPYIAGKIEKVFPTYEEDL